MVTTGKIITSPTAFIKMHHNKLSAVKLRFFVTFQSVVDNGDEYYTYQIWYGE